MPERDTKPIADYVSVLIRWRRVVALNVIVIAVVTAVVSLIVPKWYTSTGSILPSQAGAADLGIMSLVETALPLLRIPGMSGSSEVVLGILLSRTIAEDVIVDNDLEEVYRTETIDETIEALSKHTDVTMDENSVLTIEVEARDPGRAANMVWSYINALERYNLQARSTAGKRAREFVEGRIEKTMENLSNAEVLLANFQEDHGSIRMDEQATASIAALAELEARAAQTEIKLGIVRSYATEGHPEVTRLKTELREYREAIEAMRTGVGGEEADGRSTFAPLVSLPDLALEYARLYRDVEVLSNVYLFLVQELEAAKLQEARDTPTVQILDEPAPPERKSRPRRTVMVIVAALIGLIVGSAMAFFLEFLSTSDQSNPTRRTLDAAIAAFRGDVARMRGRGSGPPSHDA